MTLLYRNATDSYLGYAHVNLEDNFRNLFEQPQVNSLSLRISYYLDYNRVKSWFKAGDNPQNRDGSLSYLDSKMGKIDPL